MTKKKGVESISWLELSRLGLVEKINREVLHPLGLAVGFNPDTGTSRRIYVAPDGIFEFDPEFETTMLPEDKLKEEIAKLREGE